MMSTPPTSDAARLEQLGTLLEQSRTTPIGDSLAAAIAIFEQIEDPMVRRIAEEAMRGLRAIASRAQPGDLLFHNPPKLARDLTDMEFLQLARIDVSVHELCYCCEMIQTAANVTWEGSSPVRFYLNGLYHYVSSLFLVDTSKPTHKGLPMGGTVIRAVFPMGLADILEPIKTILDEPLGEITFGETILNLRHSDLVHGDFSPERIEYLIKQTQIRDPNQQERFAHLIWLLFHRLVMLHLKLMALIAADGKDIGAVTLRYLAQMSKKKGTAGSTDKAA